MDDIQNRELIVIGAGLSGLSVAITAASKGMDVLVLEKKESLDHAGIIDELCYTHALKQVLSDYKKFDGTFTPLTRRAFWIMTSDSHTAWECVSPSDDSGRSGFVASRPKLDIHLVDRFLAHEGTIKFGCEVVELISEDRKIAGVRIANGDEYYASQIIIANGPSSLLADKILSRSKLDVSDQLMVMKENLIFHDAPFMRIAGGENEGASLILLGDPLETGFSWARIISYGDNLIIKAYVPYNMVSEKQDEKLFVDRLKKHPSVAPIVKWAEPVSFTKSIVPIGGFEKSPELLWGDGFTVTGKAARLYHPFDCRMTDYSIVSGVAAGTSVVDAKHDRHASRATGYPAKIQETFILHDRKTMSNFMNEIRVKRQFGTSYPEIVFDMTECAFTMDSRRKGVKKNDTIREARSKSALWTMVSDFMRLLKLYS